MGDRGSGVIGFCRERRLNQVKTMPSLRSKVMVKVMLTEASALAPTKVRQGKHEEKESFFNEAKDLKRFRHKTKKSVKQRTSCM